MLKGAGKRKVFSLRLKVLVSVSCCNEDGRVFQALDPAHENERSPKLRHVRGRSYRWQLLVECRRGCQWRRLMPYTMQPQR